MVNHLTAEERAKIHDVCSYALQNAGYGIGQRPDRAWRDACVRSDRERRALGMCHPVPVPTVSLSRLLRHADHHEWYLELMEGTMLKKIQKAADFT
jgi:hypothetical protein